MNYITGIRSVVSLWAIVACCSTGSHVAWGDVLNWAVQFGSDGTDYAVDVAADANGNTYIAGSLGGVPSENDIFVAKYNASGQLIWQKKIGDWNVDERTFGMFVDDTGVYVDVVTLATRHAIQHYNLNGVLQSTTPLGSLLPTFHQDVNWDKDRNFLLAGFDTAGAVVSKYAKSGAFQWTRTLASVEFAHARSVAADSSGNVFVAGDTGGSLGGPNVGESDSFIGKYDPLGALQWVAQIGSNKSEWVNEVATDTLGNVYLAGATEGNIGGANAGSADAFVCKYDPNGTLQWSRQIGSSSSDAAHGLAVDGLGNVFVTGFTGGNLAAPLVGWDQIFVSKINASGALLWTQQVGVAGLHYGSAINVDALGNLVIGGYSGHGSLTQIDPGGGDAFIAKVNNPVPEPSTLALASVGILLWLRNGRRQS